ncbi:MAG: hypothetical protein Q7K45_00885, partial [Nanoarchaeota archaeon]|nr:hypothetical protein [Nanoarchaeota archaeon]
WFTLLGAYIYILIDIVLAPFWIMGGMIPGSPVNISGWLRDILSNLLAFPATIGMFLLGKAFMDAFGTKAEGQFVPPLIGNPGDTSAIGAFIGLGIILLTPNVVNMLKSILKAPKIDTGGVGKAIGAGVALPASTFKGVGGIVTAGKEGIPNEFGRYEKRGNTRAFLGRLFGR